MERPPYEIALMHDHILRLEEEKQSLIKDWEEKKNIAYEIACKNEKLKAENERLQEEREKAKNYNLEYGQLLIKATNKNNKFKQTLIAIKEIVIDTGEQRPPFDWDKTSDNLKLILQKISECEVKNV